VAKHCPASRFVVILEGHEIDGRVLSSTTTSNAQTAKLELESVPTNTSAVGPTEKYDPDGAPVKCCTVTPQLSEKGGAV